LGLLILALGLGAVAAMALTGRIIGHFGTPISLLVFTTAMAFGFRLMVLLGSLWALVPVLVFLGASIGGMDVAMNANAVEVERGLKRAIMSSSHGFWSLGGFLGSAFGGFLLAPFGAMVQELLVSLFVLLFFWSLPLPNHAFTKGSLLPCQLLPSPPRALPKDLIVLDWRPIFRLYVFGRYDPRGGHFGLGRALFG